MQLKWDSFNGHTSKVLRQILKKSPRLEIISLRLSNADNFQELATVLTAAFQKRVREVRIRFIHNPYTNKQKAFALELQKIADGGWKKVVLPEPSK